MLHLKRSCGVHAFSRTNAGQYKTFPSVECVECYDRNKHFQSELNISIN